MIPMDIGVESRMLIKDSWQLQVDSLRLRESFMRVNFRDGDIQVA
jgi:hypothetical protein